MRRQLSLTLTSAAFVAALALTGCSTGEGTATGAAAQQQTEQQSKHTTGSAATGLTLDAGWAKAADGMSGVFGTLHNPTDTDVTLVSATSSVADVVELHESVTSGASATMREVDGGFTVPAGGTFELVPGGNHIMLMELAAALLPGDEVPVTLTFDDGSTVEVTVLAKSYAGAEENYEGDTEDAHAEH
ncbi:copper chaperone PCu(A)C [Leucobacter sp. HY1908]